MVLNLANNAIYAARKGAEERKGIDTQARAQAAEHESASPGVWISTHRRDHVVEIRVRDNGPGIPVDIREKIFQPFFTTKPTGEGTGLGLSMSYDIIVHGHGGTLTCSDNPGGAEFVITLPHAV